MNRVMLFPQQSGNGLDSVSRTNCLQCFDTAGWLDNN